MARRGGRSGGHQEDKRADVLEGMLQDIASSMKQMQDAMMMMQLKMERTDVAVRGVAQRLRVQGPLVHNIGKRMDLLERRLNNFAQQGAVLDSEDELRSPPEGVARPPQHFRLTSIPETSSCPLVPRPLPRRPMMRSPARLIPRRQFSGTGPSSNSPSRSSLYSPARSCSLPPSFMYKPAGGSIPSPPVHPNIPCPQPKLIPSRVVNMSSSFPSRYPARASSIPRTITRSNVSRSPSAQSFSVSPCRSSVKSPEVSFSYLQNPISPSLVPSQQQLLSRGIDQCLGGGAPSKTSDSMEKIHVMNALDVYRFAIPSGMDLPENNSRDPSTKSNQSLENSSDSDAQEYLPFEPVPTSLHRFGNVRASVYPHKKPPWDAKTLKHLRSLSLDATRGGTGSGSGPATSNASRQNTPSRKRIVNINIASNKHHVSPKVSRPPSQTSKRATPASSRPQSEKDRAAHDSRPRVLKDAAKDKSKSSTPAVSRSPSALSPPRKQSASRKPRSAATSPITTLFPRCNKTPVGYTSTSSADSGNSVPRVGGVQSHKCGSSASCATSTQTYGLNYKRLSTLGKNLLNASQEGRTEAVRKLLNAGAATDFTFGSKWTALHRAAAKAHADVVSLLINRGANVNAKTCGYSALHLAAYNDQTGRCVKRLIDAGSDLDCGNNFGRTPLHYAAEYGNEAAVRVLIAAGACRGAKDKEGKTPFDVAKSHCIKRLLAPYCRRVINRFRDHRTPL